MIEFHGIDWFVCGDSFEELSSYDECYCSQVKYLEEHINKIVVAKVEREKIRDIKMVHIESNLQQEKNEMDKKRMEFARKIVHLKILRDLNPDLRDQYADLYLDHKLEF